MTRIPTRRPAGPRPAVAGALSAEVVVVGGGPAATSAALAATESGADVVLADKGHCGTSGPTASGWYRGLVRRAAAGPLDVHECAGPYREPWHAQAGGPPGRRSRAVALAGGRRPRRGAGRHRADSAGLAVAS